MRGILASALVVPVRGSGAPVAVHSAAGPPTDELAPTALGRYSVLYRVGEGGMGVVYAAYDPQLERNVALKVLRGGDALDHERVCDQERLVAEARALARLNHRNVVAVHDVWVERGRVVVAMELVDGETLTSRLARGAMCVREALHVFDEAGQGLCAAHEAGVVHGDFKPDNVLLAKDGRVLVTDFGLARDEGSSKPLRLASARVVGTPGYMAPEQAREVQADARSDQYGFCVALVEALTGRRPHPATHGTNAAGRTPPGIRAVLARGLQAEPEQRFSSLRALLNELRRAQQRVRARRRWCAVGGAVALGLLGLWVMYRRSPGCDSAQLSAWSPATRAKIALQFEASGRSYAYSSWLAARDRLNSYAGQWQQQHDARCKALGRGEAADDPELACLRDRDAEFTALIDELRTADGSVVRHAVRAASRLSPPHLCAHARHAHPSSASREFRGLRELMAKQRANAEAGRFVRAAQLAQMVSARARVAGDAQLLAEALYAEGRLAMAQGDTEHADTTLREAVQVAAVAGDDRVAAQAWTARVGVVGYGQARHERVDEVIAAARAAVTRMGEAAPFETEPFEAELDTMIGAARLQQGRADDARRHFERAFARLSALNRSEHPELARLHNNIGAAHLLAAQYESARLQFEQALEVGERTQGAEHPAIAVMQANLAAVWVAQGRIEDARRSLAEATRIWTLDGARPSRKLAQVEVTRTWLQIYDGKLVAAEQSARAAVAVLAPLHGDAHPDAARSLSVLGTVLLRRDQVDEAYVVLSQAAAMESVLRERPGDLAAILTGLGLAHLKRGERVRGVHALERALRLREQAVGRPTELPRLRFALAQAIKSEDLRRAVELARASAAGYERLPVAHPMRAAGNEVRSWLSQTMEK